MLTNFVICLLPGNSATSPSPSPYRFTYLSVFSLFSFILFLKKTLQLPLLIFTSSNLGSIIIFSLCLRINFYQGATTSLGNPILVAPTLIIINQILYQLLQLIMCLLSYSYILVVVGF